MPTILRELGFRCYFYSHEPNEPAHVPVDKNENSAKFWISPLQLAWNVGYSAKDLAEVRALLERLQPQFLEAWSGYFGLKGR